MLPPPCKYDDRENETRGIILWPQRTHLSHARARRACTRARERPRADLCALLEQLSSSARPRTSAPRRPPRRLRPRTCSTLDCFRRRVDLTREQALVVQLYTGQGRSQPWSSMVLGRGRVPASRARRCYARAWPRFKAALPPKVPGASTHPRVDPPRRPCASQPLQPAGGPPPPARSGAISAETTCSSTEFHAGDA